MATVRATFRQTVQVRDYETATVELTVERELEPGETGSLAVKAGAMYRELAAVGEHLLGERLSSPDRLRPRTPRVTPR